MRSGSYVEAIRCTYSHTQAHIRTHTHTCEWSFTLILDCSLIQMSLHLQCGEEIHVELRENQRASPRTQHSAVHAFFFSKGSPSMMHAFRSIVMRNSSTLKILTAQGSASLRLHLLSVRTQPYLMQTCLPLFISPTRLAAYSCFAIKHN